MRGYMDAECQLTQAIEIAAGAHRNQLDKGGEAYILHALAVMYKVGPDRTRMIAAVLHDTKEDCPEYMKDIDIRARFGPRVALIVGLLTREAGEMYFDYIDRVAGHPDAAAIKKADLTHNMDTGRLPQGTLGERDYQRWDKYRRALVKLEREI